MKYTVNRGSQELGKFELADIKALINAGVILPTDYFWFQGMPDWKPVGSLFQQEAVAIQPASPHSLPVARAEDVGQVVMTKDIGPSCPSCQSTDVIRAFTAYEASSHKHSMSAYTSNLIGFWAGGESINKVGVKCAPPTKPELIDSSFTQRILTVALGLMGLAFGMFSIVGLVLVDGGHGKAGDTAFVLAFAAGSFFSFLFSYRAWMKGKRDIQDAYQKAMRRYKDNVAAYARTWHCNKCGVMYLK